MAERGAAGRPTPAISPRNCTRNDLRRPEIQNFPGGACPQTPLAGALCALLYYASEILVAPLWLYQSLSHCYGLVYRVQSTAFAPTRKTASLRGDKFVGSCKSWTLDCGLQCGLEYGLEYLTRNQKRLGIKCACTSGKSSIVAYYVGTWRVQLLTQTAH